MKRSIAIVALAGVALVVVRDEACHVEDSKGTRWENRR